MMDLVAGEAREILLTIGVEDWDSLRDPGRFVAHLSLGRSMDLTWLDLFSEAARDAVGDDSPAPFSNSTYPLESRLAALSDRNVERVEPDWVDAVAMLPESDLDRVAARWIDLVECEECSVEPDEKPMLRQLAGELVDFCRRSEGAEDVLFIWSI